MGSALIWRSWLNLGPSHDSHVWDLEMIREAPRLYIDLNEVELRHDLRPSRRALIAIRDVFDLCRFPMLIQCDNGADRTGLAGTMHLSADLGVPPERAAREEFFLKYGHAPIRGIERLRESIREYREWLLAQGRGHSSSQFRSRLGRDDHSP